MAQERRLQTLPPSLRNGELRPKRPPSGFGYAVEPDPAHPTGQALCAKIRTAPELVDHLKRLTHPLRRTRPNGDPTACGADRLGRRFEPDSRGDAPDSRTIR